MAEATMAESFIEKGKLRALEEGRQSLLRWSQEIIVDVLDARFPKVSERLMSRIRAVEDPEQLKVLHRKAVIVASPADLRRDMRPDKCYVAIPQAVIGTPQEEISADMARACQVNRVLGGKALTALKRLD